MEFGDLRRWHLALVVPLIALAMLFMATQIDPDASPRTAGPDQFMRDVMSPEIEPGRPLVKSIRVMPPVDGVQQVLYSKYAPHSKDPTKWGVQEWGVTAKLPFRGWGEGAPTDATGQTVQSWLDRQRKQHTGAAYTYQWWRQGKGVFVWWGVATGVLWVWALVPAVAAMRASGGTKRPARREAVAVKSTAAADDAALNDMIARMEAANPGDVPATGATAATAATAAKSDGAVKPLVTQPLAAPVSAEQTEQEAREYRGEFYPTAKGKTGGK